MTELNLAALVPVQDEAPPATESELVFRWFETTSNKAHERPGQADSITRFVLERDGEPTLCYIGSEDIRTAVEAIVAPTTPVIVRGQVGMRGIWFGYPHRVPNP